jgi:hypothetical protein
MINHYRPRGHVHAGGAGRETATPRVPRSAASSGSSAGVPSSSAIFLPVAADRPGRHAYRIARREYPGKPQPGGGERAERDDRQSAYGEFLPMSLRCRWKYPSSRRTPGPSS